MADPWIHAQSSAKKFGGKPEDYHDLHLFIDSSKYAYGTWKHRAILHNAFGIMVCEKVFGPTITNSDSKKISTKLLATTHIVEDLGFLPSVQDWLKDLPNKPWMTKGVQKIDLENANVETNNENVEGGKT